MPNLPFPGGPLLDEPVGGTDNDLADSPIGNTDNVLADSPVGGTSNDLADSPRAGTSNILVDLQPVGGGASHVPLNGTEPGIIFGVNLNNERVDVTGNHTIANNVQYTAAKSYDGLRHMAQLPVGTSSRIFTDSGTAHNIATASPVSYGGMFIINTSQTFDNVTLFSSSQGSGASNQNYGFRVKETETAFQRVPGAVNFTQAIPRDTHVHIVVVEPAGRLSAKLYVNGILQDTSIPLATGQPNAGNEVWLGELAGAASTSAGGWVSDAFISSLELSDAQVLAYATNAFGGTPPAAP